MDATHEIRDALRDTDGVTLGDGYEVHFGGACPVQGWGSIDGHPCYFRARGTGWRVEIFSNDSGLDESNYVSKWCDEGIRPIFMHGDDNAYGEYEAGWLPAENTCRHIADAVDAFRKSLTIGT